MIKGIIFDLDGVIADSVKMHYSCWLDILKKMGFKFSWEIYDKINGMSSRECSIFLKKYYKAGFNSEKLSKDKENLARKRRSRIRIFKGALTAIKTLHDNNLRIAVASSSKKEYINAMMKKAKIGKYINAKASKEDVKHTKPHPQIFLFAAKKLKLKPKKCVVTEDAINGVIAAKRAKMKCIALTTTTKKNKLKKAKPDIVLRTIKNISFSIIKKLGE